MDKQSRAIINEFKALCKDNDVKVTNVLYLSELSLVCDVHSKLTPPMKICDVKINDENFVISFRENHLKTLWR